MAAVKGMSKIIAGAVRNEQEATRSESIKLYAQAKEPKKKTHKRPVSENGFRKKDPASEPGNQHGRSGMTVPSVFRVTPSEVPGESNTKSGWGGSKSCK